MFGNDMFGVPPLFNVMFTVVPILIGCVFVFVLLNMISPRFRGYIMSRNVRSMRHMMDYSKDDLEHMGTSVKEMGVDIQEKVLDRNEDRMRRNASRTASVYEDAIRTTVGAVADGIHGERKMIYCRHCGEPIEADSRFCRHCGKEQ